jgi:hypothetical protein
VRALAEQAADTARAVTEGEEFARAVAAVVDERAAAILAEL